MPFTPCGPDAERVEIEAEIYCHGNPARIALTPGELLAIRPQQQTHRNRDLPGQVSNYILINNKVIIDNSDTIPYFIESIGCNKAIV